MVNQTPEQPEYEFDWQNPNRKSFDFGRAFTRAFDVLKRDGIKMSIMSLALIGLPMFLLSIWPMFADFSSISADTDFEDFFSTYGPGLIAVVGLGIILIIIASLWLQPALIKMSYASMSNEDLSIGTALRQSTRFVLPCLGLSILYGIGVLLGFIALIIPALFIGLGWLLAYQIMILEDVGVTDSLRRAWNLSKGSKRWIFLMSLVFGVIGALIGAVLSIPIYLIGDPALAMMEGASSIYWIFNGVVSAISQVIGTVLGAVWTTSIYAEIRQIKEGLDLTNQADVFS